jgi:trans-4-hydroxy-L-proline dehydratase
VKRVNLDERISTLRQRCLERKNRLPPLDGDARIMARSLIDSAHEASWTIRRAWLSRDILANVTFDLDDLELLVGRLAPDRPEWQMERKEAEAYLHVHYPNLRTPGQSGHCQLDLSRLFDLGIDGLIESIETRRYRVDARAAEVYQSFIMALRGFSLMIENAACLVAQMLSGSKDERAAELQSMNAACLAIAHLPPRSFHQAIQLTWFAILACHVADRAWLVSPGHLDRYLSDFYRKDVEAGQITSDFALSLIECLYLLINETIPDGLAVSVMVGGRDAGGQDLTNPVSHLCLEALRRTRLVYPTVGICWHEATPQSLTDLAIDLITKGYMNPAFFGDETIQRGLRSYGVPVDESWDYVNSTCVEITPCGSSNVWVASPYYSTCKILLEELSDQVRANDVAPTFTDFLNRYRLRLSAAIAEAVTLESAHRKMRQQYGGKPLQSVFTRDCIDRGRDIDDGGARYNWVECSFVGLANLADSLYVLNQEVYVQKKLSMVALLEILEANFTGYENFRLRFLNHYPKYGNGISQVDCLVQEIIQFIQSECQRYRVEPEASYVVPGAFCWVMHEQLGRECGATPDGRHAGFPFADGCGAAQGRERLGPTAAILSVTSWDASPLIGGAAFNMKFNASLFSGSGTGEKLRDLVLTFLRLGGFETQINVLDAAVLRQAQENPEAYRDLVVRIGGYTDYFTRLTPEMQAELIQRTEYNEI